jgi:type IV pilus assembly protein PilV
MNRKRQRRLRAVPGGFTLIEVLVAIVVLAFGLLGFALLQTMSVRFTQSANYRTQATNLAYDLIDQMRANRFQAAWYSTASFSAGSVAVPGSQGLGRNRQRGRRLQRWQRHRLDRLGRPALGQGQPR